MGPGRGVTVLIVRAQALRGVEPRPAVLMGSSDLGQPADGAGVVLSTTAVALAGPVGAGAVVVEELLHQPRCHSQLLRAQRVGIVRHVAFSLRLLVGLQSTTLSGVTPSSGATAQRS